MLPAAGIIVVGLREHQIYRQVALVAGADEFVFKGQLVTELMPAVRRALQAGRLWKQAVAKATLERKNSQDQCIQT